MKNTKVTLVPLTNDDREQFILDNQWAFKYGAMMEFCERDDHIDGCMSILTGIAANKSIATGLPVDVKGLVDIPGFKF